MPLKDATISINGLTYPCTEWGVVEEGELLSETWDKGFARGMGQNRETDPERYFYAHNFDTSLPPYIRLGLDTQNAFTSLTSFDSTNPFFTFLVKSTSDFVYLLSGRRGYKIKLSDNSVEDTHDFGANAVCGRPALFEGKWYIPLGPTVDAVELTTIASSGGDTFNTLNVNALAFATVIKDGIAQLARAHTTNLVDLTGGITRAAIDWAGADFEVGDSSLAINDMVTWKNELAVSKPDSVYRFDIDGQASPLIPFVGRSLNPLVGFEGQSAVHGPYLFWPHSSGLWRVLEDAALSVGPETASDYIGLTNSASKIDSTLATPSDFQWKSAAAWGKWFYACTANTIFYGEIRGNGTILWHGSFPAALGNAEHLAITEGGSGSVSGQPLLWIANTSNQVNYYELQTNGSLRSGLGDTTELRGPTGTTSKFATSRTDLASGKLRSKLKQLRRVWVRTEEESGAAWDSDLPLQIFVVRDNKAAQNIGDTIIGDGYFERSPTAGTNDQFYELRMGFRVVSAKTANDARIADFGIDAVTASVYRAVLQLTPSRIKGHNRSAKRMLKELRDLKNGLMVVIRDPENPSPTSDFRAQVVSVAETAVDANAGQTGYTVQVRLERFDWQEGI